MKIRNKRLFDSNFVYCVDDVGLEQTLETNSVYIIDEILVDLKNSKLYFTLVGKPQDLKFESIRFKTFIFSPN